MAALIANSQQASGGVSSVTVPVQGSQFVNAQWSDYSGSFNQPSVQQGAYNAEFNLKLMIAPVPFLGMEGAVQQDAAVIPLIEARMNDATNVMMDAMATSLYNNSTNTQQFTGSLQVSGSTSYGPKRWFGQDIGISGSSEFLPTDFAGLNYHILKFVSNDEFKRVVDPTKMIN